MQALADKTWVAKEVSSFCMQKDGCRQTKSTDNRQIFGMQISSLCISWAHQAVYLFPTITFLIDSQMADNSCNWGRIIR